MRVVVASQDRPTRLAIAMLIEAQSDLDLTGDVADLTDLLANIKSTQPELVVLDWDVLGQRFETLQTLLELFDSPPMIVALSVHEASRSAAIDSGVAGFAYKGAAPSELLRTIRECQRK